jgi:Protein of unknown function (DUF3667)
MRPPDDTASTCRNCQWPLAPEPPPFCPGCGQEVRLKPPTVGEFLQQFGGAYLSTEGALWRTLKLLFTRPGALTRAYLDGRRKHYVLPLRLYLTLSVVALLLVRLLGNVAPLSGADSPELATAMRQAQPTAIVNFYGSKAGLRQGVLVCERMPQWVCERIGQQVRADPAGFLAKLKQANQRVLANWSIVMLVLLPLFTVGLRLVYADRPMVYAEHLVYALHLHAFWACVLPLLLVEWQPLTLLTIAVMVVYTLMAERVVYGGRWWARLARGVPLALYYWGLLTLAVPLAELVSLLW